MKIEIVHFRGMYFVGFVARWEKDEQFRGSKAIVLAFDLFWIGVFVSFRWGEDARSY